MHRSVIGFFFLLSTSCSANDSYKLYIYDWPDEIQSAWPEKSTILQKTKRGPDYKHGICDNFGHGPEVDSSNGLYATHSFCIYAILMGRLRVHPRRTTNRSEASIFIIPHDIGVAAQWDKATGKYLMHQRNGCPQNETVAKLLRQELSQSKYYGHDNVIINSLFDIFNPDCLEFFFLCANCTVLSQEVHYVNHYTNAVSQKMGRPLGRRWYTAPFASSFHWHDRIERLPWLVDRSNPRYLVSFWGSLAVQIRRAMNLRIHLKRDCDRHPDDCYNVEVANRAANVGSIACSSTMTKNCNPKDNTSVAMTGLEAYNSSGESCSS